MFWKLEAEDVRLELFELAVLISVAAKEIHVVAIIVAIAINQLHMVVLV